MAPRQHPESALSELGLYGEGEASEGVPEEPFDNDPLSDESLAALRRLARYKPPKDTCES